MNTEARMTSNNVFLTTSNITLFRRFYHGISFLLFEAFITQDNATWFRTDGI